MRCYNAILLSNKTLPGHSEDVRAVKITKADGHAQWAWLCDGCRDEAMSAPETLRLEVSEVIHPTFATR